MISNICGSMGSLKSENSFTNKQPTSSNEDSFVSSSIKKGTFSSDFDQNLSSLTPTSLSLTPSSLNLQGLKFEADTADVEIQSPDWDSFFTDQFDNTDFMISSPVNLPTSPIHNSYAFAQSVGQNTLFGCSPPRFPSPLGAFNSHHNKNKGMSPLHRVFNSSSSQYTQIESLSNPGIEEFLNDEYIGAYSNNGKMSSLGGESSGLGYDIPAPNSNNNPAMLESMSMPHSSRFCGSETSGSQGSCSQLTQESGDVYRMRSQRSQKSAPRSQQLKQEDEQEEQQKLQRQQQQKLNHNLMAPIPSGVEQDADSGLQLVHLLLACAEAVAKEDYMLSRRYLHHLNRVVTPLGDSMQRVASCFTEALSARLAATLTTNPNISTSKPFNPFPPNSLEILKIYQILYQACPYVKFAHFTANQAIFEAFENEERVHVIDLDILQGYQWPAFMQALAARPGGAPFLRITGVGSSPESVRETGCCLAELANSLHVPFEFHPVDEELEDLKPHMFNRRVGEALAVNSVNRLHRVPNHCLGNLLTMIRDQAPNIVTLVEQEASHNGPYFLGRFLEALHYYSAIFDSLDATFPPDSAQRAKVEQYIFAPEIRNIVATEGSERVMRHERLEKWRKIMEGKGFKGIALSANAVTQSKILLGLYSCDGYSLTEDKGCLLLGWQDRAILAASAWRC